MQYIILDLEWNQPINYQNRTYQLYGDRLTFELIQIGAVRITENLEIADSISIPIQPTCYTVIHPRVRSMTHLGYEELAGCPHFQEAMEQFVSWCGDDYVLLTWGCVDVSVLQQNLDFFDVHPPLPTLYDIQPLFVREFHLDNRMGLKSALELMELEEDENRFFHDALNDAWYTANIFVRLPSPEAVLEFPQTPKPLIPQASHARKGDLFPSVADALESSQATSPLCPVCARETALDGPYIPQTNDKFIGLSKCKKHGILLIRIRFDRKADGMFSMVVRGARASRSNIAYIHTKQFQLNERQNAGRDVSPDKLMDDARGGDSPLGDDA